MGGDVRPGGKSRRERGVLQAFLQAIRATLRDASPAWCDHEIRKDIGMKGHR
jgi:hypothetical protein